MTAAAAACLALSSAGPLGSPMERSISVMPLACASLRFVLIIWNTFSPPWPNLDRRIDFPSSSLSHERLLQHLPAYDLLTPPQGVDVLLRRTQSSPTGPHREMGST